MRLAVFATLGLAGYFCFATDIATAVETSVKDAPAGWSTAAPRDEIRPLFRYEPNGGHGGQAALVIAGDDREGTSGWWQKSFPVEGGKTYRFTARRKTDVVASPRQSGLARVLWRDAKGGTVKRDEQTVGRYLHGSRATAEPEYPTDKQIDSEGWTEVSDTYEAPNGATQAIVELHYRWGHGGKIAWSDVSLMSVKYEPRIARLAAVHYRPHEGKTPAAKREQFAPLIAKAAEQKADLVVLPETLTYYQTGLSYSDVAEPIPGPSTDYFGALAKKHDLYIVAGLLERDEPLIYNVAVCSRGTNIRSSTHGSASWA